MKDNMQDKINQLLTEYFDYTYFLMTASEEEKHKLHIKWLNTLEKGGVSEKEFLSYFMKEYNFVRKEDSMDTVIQCQHCKYRASKWSDTLRVYVCPECHKHTRLQDICLHPEIHNSLMKGKENIMPGSRVRVWDVLREKYRIATVINRYGIAPHRSGSYVHAPEPDLVDVDFDGIYIGKNHRSKGHFTYGVILVNL